jgi:hypothetical protein
MSTRKRRDDEVEVEVDLLTAYENRNMLSWHYQQESTVTERDTVNTPNAMIHGAYVSQFLNQRSDTFLMTL